MATFGKTLVVILAAAGLLFAAANLVKHSVFNIEEKLSLQIGNVKLEVEIAETDAARVRGLSGRAALSENQGMLFVFDEPGQYGFWMKDMNFPIDIVWINKERRVVGITPNVPPDSYPQIFYPPAPIKYALEVKAGWIGKNNLQIDERILFKK